MAMRRGAAAAYPRPGARGRPSETPCRTALWSGGHGVVTPRSRRGHAAVTLLLQRCQGGAAVTAMRACAVTAQSRRGLTARSRRCQGGLMAAALLRQCGGHGVADAVRRGNSAHTFRPWRGPRGQGAVAARRCQSGGVVMAKPSLCDAVPTRQQREPLLPFRSWCGHGPVTACFYTPAIVEDMREIPESGSLLNHNEAFFRRWLFQSRRATVPRELSMTGGDVDPERESRA